MTSHTPNPPALGLPRWLVIVLLAIVFSGPMLAVLRAPGIGRISTRPHAVERHGVEAEAIRECLQRHGADMIWAKRDDPEVYIFCVDLHKDEELRRSCGGRWGALFALFRPGRDCDYEELTAFSPKDGSYHRVTDYLSRFARKLK